MILFFEIPDECEDDVTKLLEWMNEHGWSAAGAALTVGDPSMTRPAFGARILKLGVGELDEVERDQG